MEEDRATLEEMIRTVGGTANPVKQAGAWIMEKFSRIKLSPGGLGSEEMSALLTVETLCIGVDGKLCLWTALKEVAEQAGMGWDAVGAALKQQGRLHLETY